MSMKPTAILAAIAVLLGAGVAAYGLMGHTPPDTQLRSAGIIEGREVNLASQVQGRIAEICCREGDQIPAGQLLVSLDSRDLAAALAQAEAEEKKAQVQLTDAESRLVRTRGLSGKHFASQQDLDDALAARNEAEAALQAAQAAVAYDRVKLDETRIISPMDGTLVYQFFAAGEIVSPGQTILTLVDTRHLYARLDVDETRIDDLALGTPARLSTLGKPPHRINGRVSEIGRYADFATQRDVTRGRQDIRTFRVRVAVDDPQGVLKPGMTVEVTIPRGTSR
jgi:RND family efflux transporter MFP subunit